MTTRLLDIKAEIAGLHLSFIGFIVLWFNQAELELSQMGMVEFIGWGIVLAGGAVTFLAYFEAGTDTRSDPPEVSERA